MCSSQNLMLPFLLVILMVQLWRTPMVVVFNLKLYSTHFFRCWFGGGSGNNIRTQLLACWGLLYFAFVHGCAEIHICVDSKFVMDWIFDHSHLQVVYLSYWMQNGKRLRDFFIYFSFHYVFREFNWVANNLSKKAVDEDFGVLKFQEFQDIYLLRNGTHNLF